MWEKAGNFGHGIQFQGAFPTFGASFNNSNIQVQSIYRRSFIFVALNILAGQCRVYSVQDNAD